MGEISEVYIGSLLVSTYALSIAPLKKNSAGTRRKPLTISTILE